MVGVDLATWNCLNEDMNFVLGVVRNVHPTLLPIKLLQRAQPALDLFSCCSSQSTARFSVSLCQRLLLPHPPRYAPQSLAKIICRHSISVSRTAGRFSELPTHNDLFVSGALLQRWVHSSACLLSDQLPPNSPLIKTVCAVVTVCVW